jgi:hypothetical protein
MMIDHDWLGGPEPKDISGLERENKSLTSQLSSVLESYNRECKRNEELKEQLAYCHGRMNEAYNEIRSQKEAMTLIVKVTESQKEEIELYREALKTAIGYPITEDDLIRRWNDDFDLFPLPICFDPREEQKELYGRGQEIERKAKETLSALSKHQTNKER